MTKLTIEEKAKAYDDLLVRLKKAKVDNDVCDERYCCVIDDIVPELKENEDELTWLTNYISEEVYSLSMDIRDNEDRIKLKKLQKSLAWLEKQGEQKSDPYNGLSFVYNNHTWGMCARDGGVDILCDSKLIKHIEYPQYKTILENLSEQKQEWGEEDENECNHILKLLNLVAEEQETKGYNNLISSVNWLKSIKDRIQSKQSNKPQGKTALEAINEENVDKPFDYENGNIVQKDFAPKFEVGDWITFFGGKAFKILKVESELNDTLDYLLSDQNGHESYYNKKYIDENTRLWTIQDAKAGDVLVCPKYAGDIIPNIFIFKDIKRKDNDVYCYCSFLKVFATGGYVASAGPIDNDFCPVTKEQHDILFTKMKKAGYEWDAEKKELKKI